MSATATVPQHVSSTAGARLNVAGILRSEWIKLRSLRSTVWSYLVMVIISLGLAVLMSVTLDGELISMQPNPEGFVLQAATFGVFFSQLVVAVLGVLVISGEYSTGMIRSTLTAAPRRLSTLWAKAVVLFVTTFVVSLVSVVASFFVASAIFAGADVNTSILDENVIPNLLGAALYLALMSVFALGIGAVLRSSAGGIAAALGIILLLPIIFQMIPAAWAPEVVPYLPSSAGSALFSIGMTASTEGFELWQNALITVGWVALSLAAAAVLLKRRDA